MNRNGRLMILLLAGTEILQHRKEGEDSLFLNVSLLVTPHSVPAGGNAKQDQGYERPAALLRIFEQRKVKPLCHRSLVSGKTANGRRRAFGHSGQG